MQFDDQDLIIISDQADELAKDILHVARSSGHKAVMMNMIEASRMFSISVSDNNIAVDPDVPIFLRVPQTPTIRESFDKAFQFGECLASIWAAAAMIKSPCINRPTPHGFTGRLSASVVITELRTCIAKPSNEVYSRRIPLQLDHGENEWCIQDTATGDIAILPKRPKGQGPYKARKINRGVKYEVIVVVGACAYRSTDAPIKHLRLEQKSVKIMKNLDLTFGTVTWYVSSDGTTASVARINPFPSMEEVQYVWHLAKESLMWILSI